MRVSALMGATAILWGLGCRGPVPRTDAAPSAAPITAVPAQGALPSPPIDSASAHPVAMADCRFDSARVILGKYCADCHSAHGSHGANSKALRMLSVENYADWMKASKAVPGRVDKDSLEGRVMPPPKFPNQPSDAERKTLAAWVRRGSPNTKTGR